MSAATTDSKRPLGFARFLSWSSFIVILASTLFVSIVIANSANKTLLTKQQEFALLLAENLNHQIYRRFTLPTLIGQGRIALRQPVQYDRLEQVIQSTIHGLHVQELRIYDYERQVSYSTDRTLLGNATLAGKAVDEALDNGKHSFEIVSDISPFMVMFQFDPKPGSVTLKTYYPLKAEQSLTALRTSTAPIMGALEFSQDITADYRAVVNFQWLIISTSCASSLALFIILLIIIRRADRVNVERQAEKEALQQELHQAEKLGSMGRTVSGIAHEIRNPLGIIRSSAELLLQRAQKDNDPGYRVLKAIHDESKRLSKTVNDFLDYARPKEPKLERMDAAMVLDQALGFLESECGKCQVAVERRYAPGLFILGDTDFLYRAVYNVVTNALQAMPQGGTLTITSDIADKEIVLTVDDSGSGIDPALREKLVDPFFTTKDHGTGLGLAIVSNIVKSHKGVLELDNNPEGGARVRLRFPKA
ncbi:MAG: sensor histidine kinase [Desulfovibrionaceae bacterium]